MIGGGFLPVNSMAESVLSQKVVYNHGFFVVNYWDNGGCRV
jgi:hypothetical protein